MPCKLCLRSINAALLKDHLQVCNAMYVGAKCVVYLHSLTYLERDRDRQTDRQRESPLAISSPPPPFFSLIYRCAIVNLIEKLLIESQLPMLSLFIFLAIFSDLPAADEQPDITTLLSQHRASLCKTRSTALCRIQIRRDHAWEDALAFYRQRWTAADLAREPKVRIYRYCWCCCLLLLLFFRCLLLMFAFAVFYCYFLGAV